MSRHIQHCSACSDAGHKRPQCPRVYTCKAPPRTMERWSETHALREAVWEQLSLRFPKAPHEVFHAVRDEWGEIGERRLWRALQWVARNKPVARRPVTIDVEWRHRNRGVEHSIEVELMGYVRRAA